MFKNENKHWHVVKAFEDTQERVSIEVAAKKWGVTVEDINQYEESISTPEALAEEQANSESQYDY